MARALQAMAAARPELGQPMQLHFTVVHQVQRHDHRLPETDSANSPPALEALEAQLCRGIARRPPQQPPAGGRGSAQAHSRRTCRACVASMRSKKTKVAYWFTPPRGGN